MKNRKLWCALGFAALSQLACDDQQYVNASTVGLRISEGANGSERVSSCNFVPVLLGSTVEAHYTLDDGLEATLTITRDTTRVSFQGAAAPAEAFQVDAIELATETSVSDPDPPSGYSVTLTGACSIGAP